MCGNLVICDEIALLRTRNLLGARPFGKYLEPAGISKMVASINIRFLPFMNEPITLRRAKPPDYGFWVFWNFSYEKLFCSAWLFCIRAPYIVSFWSWLVFVDRGTEQETGKCRRRKSEDVDIGLWRWTVGVSVRRSGLSWKKTGDHTSMDRTTETRTPS